MTQNQVESLHMVTISPEAHADEKNEMERVYTTIRYLQAEDEVAAFATTSQADKKQQAKPSAIKKGQ